jgi:PadR family transcriptional regulator PadR
MPRNRIPSPQTTKVLAALAADPQRWRYGYELGAETELKAGSLYPILVRLADRGLLEARWEETPPQGRPARHLYRLTAGGLELAAAAASSAAASRASAATGRLAARSQPDGA